MTQPDDTPVFTLYTCYLYNNYGLEKFTDRPPLAIKSLTLLTLTANNGETIGWCETHGLIQPARIGETHESMQVRLTDHVRAGHPGYTTP